MFCPHCGKQVPDDAGFCTGCGKTMPDLAKLESSPPSQPPAPPRAPAAASGPQVCSRCRREGPANITVCPDCGGPMRAKGSGANTAVVVGLLAVGCLVMVAMVAILAAILVPNFVRARAQGQFTACKSNLKNLGTGLEMYSTDFEGRYPTTLGDLTPNYLKTIPTCPAAERNTYTESYQFHAEPDLYTFYCSGANHQAVGAGPNFPQYNSVQGLLERGGY